MAAGALPYRLLPLTASDVPQFRQIGVGLRPGFLGQRELDLCGTGIAIMLRDKAERVMSAGVAGILRRQLPGGERRELPVAGLPGGARDAFDGEQGLRPGIGSRRFTKAPDDLV